MYIISCYNEIKFKVNYCFVMAADSNSVTEDTVRGSFVIGDGIPNLEVNL